jgi:AcrR family transcriptional regulator
MTRTKKRKYELKERARQLEQTRLRITEATIELHRTIGPAATQVSEVARRAGVQRRTVYNHFPDQVSLLRACSAHWRALHPAPDPASWLVVRDPGERLRRGLRELFAWYRETEPMTAKVLRDAEGLPELRAIIDSGLGTYLLGVRRILQKSFRARGRRRDRIEVAVGAAVDFHFWRLLSALGDGEAAELGAGLVELAGELEPSRAIMSEEAWAPGTIWAAQVLPPGSG